MCFQRPVRRREQPAQALASRRRSPAVEQVAHQGNRRPNHFPWSSCACTSSSVAGRTSVWYVRFLPGVAHGANSEPALALLVSMERPLHLRASPGRWLGGLLMRARPGLSWTRPPRGPARASRESPGRRVPNHRAPSRPAATPDRVMRKRFSSRNKQRSRSAATAPGHRDRRGPKRETPNAPGRQGIQAASNRSSEASGTLAER